MAVISFRGDGVLGYLAGAAHRVGAESPQEFGEKMAPGEQFGHRGFFDVADHGIEQQRQARLRLHDVQQHHVEQHRVAPSGDGVLGYLAGAAHRVGAESPQEFGEKMAPGEQRLQALRGFFDVADHGIEQQRQARLRLHDVQQHHVCSAIWPGQRTVWAQNHRRSLAKKWRRASSLATSSTDRSR
jgi:hypothetical protein